MPTITKTKRRSYLYAVGRRKTSTARVRFYQTDAKPAGSVTVNGKPHTENFASTVSATVMEPIHVIGTPLKGYFTVRVSGGGQQSQAVAVRHGISRILVQLDESSRTLLKSKGYLKRDPRMKERKKPGLKRARRAPQWSKR